MVWMCGHCVKNFSSKNANQFFFFFSLLYNILYMYEILPEIGENSKEIKMAVVG